jgi:hypothetical protein
MGDVLLNRKAERAEFILNTDLACGHVPGLGLFGWSKGYHQ